MVWATARLAKPFTAAASSSISASSSATRIPRSAAAASMSSSASSSTYTIRAVAAFSRALLRYGCRNVTVRGLDRLLTHLHSSDRLASHRGLLTYCNHISVLDEPTIWGTLPPSTFRNPYTVRWTLGASDIMFTSPLLSRFFRSGQCIETHRGGGIYQPAIDDAIAKLDAARWVHLFPEGYVNVSTSSRLRRFKWGIARMLLEAKTLPTVVPIWITGFDRLMPEPRDKPKWLPRFGADVTIDFGEPITDSIEPVVRAIQHTHDVAPPHLLPEQLRSPATPQHTEASDKSIPSQVATEWNTSSLVSSLTQTGGEPASVRAALARSQLAALLRFHLGQVGVQQRRADGAADPEQDGTLVHTESLRSAARHAQNNVLRDGERKNVGV
ncbi:related to TAZ1-Lyso-phosphatidylcholine acyltransferase [Sporisorium reilianum SRZ2]|uniref:Tafazzin family protein n=1 Tax=Sporisorium reilianum (strain SRZ2) TaxID=999809 RepID=E6ZLA1_SPORE|nr:related to TAZ1-Lyso-phosphatidylcholine acyltransferase [Sporisorium reilianum SRZ2]